MVGAGLGGLFSAVRLQRMGFEVHLFEKNPAPGGRMGRLESGGFVFDTGPTLLLMTDVYRELFGFAGRRLEDHLELVPLDGDYRIHFGDGESLTMRRSLPELLRELERIEPGVTPRFYRFLESAALKYRLGRSEFVERNFERARDFFTPRNLRLLLRTGALANYYRVVSRHFRTERLRQAFSLQTMYLGLSPFEAPAVYALLPYTELAEDGLWFPRGGMYSLVEAVVGLARELGVRIHLRTPVERILVAKGRAEGLRVGGEDLPFNAVLVNADLPYAHRELLGGAADGDFRLRPRDRLRYTASAYMLYMGLDTRAEKLLHHNFFLSARYRENFEDIFHRRVLPDDPSFYVAAPSRTDPGMAPEGGDSLLVLVPVPHLGGRVDWRREEAGFRERVYGLLEKRCGIGRGSVLYERVRTPEDWRAEYNLERGAAFGLGHGILQVGYFRPPLASRSVRGLYFVGASTHPGTGVPLVGIGARLVSGRMQRDLMSEGWA